jgi:hypothetical protein
MNKLLQHIIDAGDVDHKVLPGLQKMQKGSYQEELPKAQWGSFVNPVTIAGAATLFAKAKEFFGFDEPKIVRTPASAPKRLSIRDPRKIMMTTGKPLRPNSDLVTGEYDSEHLGNLLTEAKRRKMSYNDMMNLAAMGFQETKWGRSDDNIGHTMGDFGDEPMQDTYSNFINAYNAKMKDADRLKIKDEATRLQVYNGLGKVFPSTEADYHGFKMKKIYGVEVPKGGIDLRKNPLYGKQVMDIRDNVLKRNPEFMRYMDSTYRAPMPKEEEFANGGLFKVFAQEGLEYKGPSIVDYLATKGYSGNKAFRKELAEKYGIEGYNFSAAKNTELLNRLRENDDLLEQNYQPTQAAIPVERMMEMESQARAARQAAAQSAPQQPAQRPFNPGNYYTYSPDYGDMRIPQPKINTSLQPKVKYDKFSLSPQMVIPLPFGFGKQTPSKISNSEITDPVRNVPARPELGPFNSERYNNVQEVDPVNQEIEPEFLFNSEKLFNSFNRPKQKPLLPVVIPAKKPVVKTEKYTKPEVEELPWYEEAANAVTNTLKGFYDDFAESVEKSPLDFRGMNFGTAVSPQGSIEMTRDLTKRGLSLFSPDMAEKYNNWLNRQQAIKNMDKDPVSKIVVPDFDYAPMYITGDTIPDGNRQYHIPESMDVDALRFGVRNRGDNTPIDTEAASITAFHPFVNAKTYFAGAKDDPANATYLAYSPDGKIQVGERKDFENKDVQVSRVFSNKVVDFVREPSGSIKKVPAGAKVNKNAFSPAVTVLDDQGKQVQGKLNLVVPQGDKADEAFGIATGGRFIFKTPDGQTRLVSGSLKNIEEEFKRIKGKNPYVTVVSLDNGSYSRGLRTKDQKLTAADLRSYDNLNLGGGGNFAYLLPGQQTSRPLAKFDEFEKEATKRLQALYPGKKVKVEYQDTGLYNQTGGRDIQTQADIQKKGNSQTGVSLHNFNAARDYVLYVDGKPISGDQSNKAGNDIYKEVLWKAADKTGVYHIDDWDVGHIGLAKEGQKTAFDELKSKYPEIFTDPNFVKSLEFINKNKSNPTYQEYYELLNNIQPFTGQPRITEFEKRKGITKKAYGGPILDPRGQWAHPGKVTRIPGSDITMQGVPYPVYGVGSNGQEQLMYPGQEYNFGGASYVDEYPIMQGGGWSGGGLSRSNLAMMSALNKNIKEQKARDAQPTISQYTPKPGDQQRMNANKDAYRKEQGKFLNRLADNQHMQAAGKNLPGAAEFALDVMTAGEAAVALKAVKPLLKAGAKYLTEKTPLRNAYKFNPSALTDNMLFNKEGVVNRQMFGDDAYNSFLKSGPTTRPNVSEYDQMMEFIKAPRSQVKSANGEVFEVAKTMEDGAFKYPYFQEGSLWYTGQQRNNLAKQIGKERIITTPKSDVWFAPAGEGTVMGGDDLISKGLIDSYSKGRRVLVPGSEYANPSKYSVFEPHWWKGYKQLQEDGGQIYPIMQPGGITPVYDGIPDPNARAEQISKMYKTKARFAKEFIDPVKNKSEAFIEGWMKSPMYAQMLYGNNPIDVAWDVDSGRKTSFDDFKKKGYWTQKDLDSDKSFLERLYSTTFGYFVPDTKEIALNRSLKDSNQRLRTAVHEVSHASDSAPDGTWMSSNDANKIKKYKQDYYNSLNTLGKLSYNLEPDMNEYIADPSETRARLNTIRFIGKEKKVYDPFNQKIDRKKLNQINDRSLDQLRRIYSDDQIVDMLNSIAKVDNTSNQTMMQVGGFKPPFGNLDLKKRWENGHYVPPLTSAATTERQFLTDWNNSAMGKKMLYDSVDKDDPSGINYLYADKIRDDRNTLIKQASVNLYGKKDFSKKVASVFSDRKDVSGIAGYATLKNPLMGKRTVDSVNEWNAALSKPGGNYVGFTMLQPNKNYEIHMHNEDEGDGGNQTLVHELGHASDASGYLMPDSDLQKIKRYSYGNDGKRQLSKFQKYVADPTETRARLLNFRYNAKNQGLYNPFNQKATGDVLKKYEDYLMDGYDPLEQLREVYNDAQIIDMLNTISQSKKQASDIIPYAKNGGYTVTRSNDRKGKTHKVTGPGGVVKYFGDSKLGQHPKDPERKKAFYARHKKNLAGNPFFRAFARKTWEDGGQTDYMQGGGLWDTDKVAYLDSTVNANRNLEFIRRAIENDGLSIPTPKGAPGYGKGMTSSHLMTYDPKSRRSYPELVNINGTLKYLTGDDAYNYAEDTGEYIQFPTAEQANYFSQNYKKSNYVKVGKQPLEKKHGIKVTYKK